MFPYRVKYIDYESDIQNNDLFYKIDPKRQNAFEISEKNRKFQKSIYLLRNSISKWSAFYGDLYGPLLAGLKF